MCYSSIFEALEDRGRFIFIFPTVGRRKENRYSTFKAHQRIFLEIGFKIICIRRHQCIPPAAYTKAIRPILNFMDFSLGKFLGIRHIIVLEKT
jgi:hypothetical protein